MNKINLIYLSTNNPCPNWQLGEVFTCKPEPAAVAECLRANLLRDDVDAWLFWDEQLKMPDFSFLQHLLTQHADVWHAGLCMGLSGKPEIIDFVSPTWMLNRDPNPEIEATSWRLSLRACLMRTDVLLQLGGPRAEFQTLEGAALEMGYRYITHGAFIRHDPGLLSDCGGQPMVNIPLIDQLRFIQSGFQRTWFLWSCWRAFLTRQVKLLEVVKAYRLLNRQPMLRLNAIYQRGKITQTAALDEKVTVLIPTINRYPYLRVLLAQLRAQTIKPLEIVIIDQTPIKDRDLNLQIEFQDLPVQWIYLDHAGQCSSRNTGLQSSNGDFILFIDDDDEVPPDLIEKHLANLAGLKIPISSGVAFEPGDGDLPPDFQFMRVSNVFPTNNTMLRRQVLNGSGLFDLAFDHGQRADHDLGMRIYLCGELLVLDPKISVLHHHAPVGGLREHKARVNTRAASRKQLFKQNLLTVSDLYLINRYFSKRQVREMVNINILGTFSIKGSKWKRILKILIAVISLPNSLLENKRRSKIADEMRQTYPKIPILENGEPA